MKFFANGEHPEEYVPVMGLMNLRPADIEIVFFAEGEWTKVFKIDEDDKEDPIVKKCHPIAWAPLPSVIELVIDSRTAGGASFTIFSDGTSLMKTSPSPQLSPAGRGGAVTEENNA